MRNFGGIYKYIDPIACTHISSSDVFPLQTSDDSANPFSVPVAMLLYRYQYFSGCEWNFFVAKLSAPISQQGSI
jgi:hypothetical protein